MAKQSGLGDNLYVAGYDYSGDITALGDIGGGPAPLENTGIDKSAFERIGGLLSGRINATTWFNPAANMSFDRLSNLPTTDVHLMYCRGTTLGNPVASMVAKEIDYAGNRADNGAFTFALSTLSNSFPLEWGRLLTAGKRTDTTATNGTSIDTTASAAFGAQAYLQVFAFTGTSVTVTVQDSADNSSFAAVTGLAFTAASAIGQERVATAAGATVRRYLRVATTGTFSNAVFAVAVVKNETAVTY